MILSVTPFLWYDDNAEPAIERYLSLFEGRVLSMNRHPDGTLFIGEIEIMGTKITLMNAGPTYKLTSAFSLAVSVETQDEIDHLTAKLTDGGGHLEMCGWLVDAFGLSWQIVPTALFQLMGDPDPEVGARVQAAMLQMQVLNIAGLQAAALGA